MSQIGSALIVLVFDNNNNADSDQHNRISEVIQEKLHSLEFVIDAIVLCSPDEQEIRNAFNTGVIGGVDLILSIGGVGITPRDIVPNVTESLLDIRLLGIEEALRRNGFEFGCIDTAMSRGLVGISGSTIIVNLVESLVALEYNMETIKPFLIKLIHEFSNI